ncbi:MAG: HAMP domain-containing histidine kinase [Proteobacteria bacterium]|nr:HAMP domain-containing histidine kinase [Pseudomonadota bacterium]
MGIVDFMESLRQVSNDIAHDLRTPLARLRQRLEAMRDHPPTPAIGRAAIEIAIAETDGILDTFSALLRIAQIEAGARKSGFGDVDMSAVFETVIDAVAPAAEDAGKQFVGRVDMGIVVRGDRDLLTQMLANLVDNAIRHTPRGARIDVGLTLGDDGAVGVVADDGDGVPRPERERIFRRFHRLERSRSTPGSGLGLSLVAAIAALHAIDIDVMDNSPGLRVALKLPAARAAKSAEG